ncbi:S-layer homology domain-containing protein [Brevibacillus sp. NSP2.1]|uniref:S-layer homology domain-containing protein n=1 Tax=Brevibacillus TaxID=55080 RepID=UPI0009D6A22D
MIFFCSISRSYHSTNAKRKIPMNRGFQGDDKGNLRPNDPITRAEAADLSVMCERRRRGPSGRA